MSREYDEPAWVEDGMVVWLPWGRETASILRCMVAVAAGNHARVVNESRKLDKWVPIGDLLVPAGDPHGYEVTT